MLGISRDSDRANRGIRLRNLERFFPRRRRNNREGKPFQVGADRNRSARALTVTVIWISVTLLGGHAFDGRSGGAGGADANPAAFFRPE